MSSGCGTFQDKTLNKVALCSAVFAGFAYVGYSYARTAFCRKLAKKPNSCKLNILQLLLVKKNKQCLIVIDDFDAG